MTMLVNRSVLTQIIMYGRRTDITLIGTESEEVAGFLFMPSTVEESYHYLGSWGLAWQSFWEEWNFRT